MNLCIHTLTVTPQLDNSGYPRCLAGVKWAFLNLLGRIRSGFKPTNTTQGWRWAPYGRLGRAWCWHSPAWGNHGIPQDGIEIWISHDFSVGASHIYLNGQMMINPWMFGVRTLSLNLTRATLWIPSICEKSLNPSIDSRMFNQPLRFLPPNLWSFLAISL